MTNGVAFQFAPGLPCFSSCFLGLRSPMEVGISGVCAPSPFARMQPKVRSSRCFSHLKRESAELSGGAFKSASIDLSMGGTDMSHRGPTHRKRTKAPCFRAVCLSPLLARIHHYWGVGWMSLLIWSPHSFPRRVAFSITASPFASLTLAHRCPANRARVKREHCRRM